MNQFVHIEYNSASSAIICKFLNQTDSLKSCTVLYGRHNQMPYRFAGKNSTLNSIKLEVDPNYLEYYYVTASSDGITVAVEELRIKTNTGDFKYLIFSFHYYLFFWS